MANWCLTTGLRLTAWGYLEANARLKGKRAYHPTGAAAHLAVISLQGRGMTTGEAVGKVAIANSVANRGCEAMGRDLMPKMKCTAGTFRPEPSANVRWLVEEKDYGLAADFWRRRGYSLLTEEWHDANHRSGFRYAALIQNQAVVSIAALIPYSSYAWEVGAIATDEPFRGRGCF